MRNGGCVNVVSDAGVGVDAAEAMRLERNMLGRVGNEDMALNELFWLLVCWPVSMNM